ncbi:MAG: YraN family protein [Synergistaceae bacterium]|nr:YraN family protein [Synergistaceae bacterium]
MLPNARDLGRRAEEYAAGYVASLGWRVEGRNVANRYGEIDILAMDHESRELVLIEVRCRTIGETQSPLDSVGPRKLRALVRAGRDLVEKRRWTGFWRIDLIGITAGRGPWRVEHIRDITAGMDVPT